MTFKLFFTKFLPFLIILIFFQGFIKYLLNFFSPDLYTALAIVLIFLLEPNFYSFLSLFILSLLKGLETPVPFYIWFMFYLFLFLFLNHFKKTFKVETTPFKFSFFALFLFLVLLIRLYYFFDSLYLSNLLYPFWLKLIGKIFLYYLFTLLCTIFLFFLSKRLLNINYA